MGRRIEQTSFSKEDMKVDKWCVKKMLNITNHKGNVNEKHNEILPHTCQNRFYQKDKK